MWKIVAQNAHNTDFKCTENYILKIQEVATSTQKCLEQVIQGLVSYSELLSSKLELLNVYFPLVIIRYLVYSYEDILFVRYCTVVLLLIA